MSASRNAVLVRYKNWLHRVAMEMAGLREGGQLVQDLAQEGYIAMWRALDSYDPDKGAEATYLTRAAEMRMRDVLYRNRPSYGATPHRGSVMVEQGGTVTSVGEWNEDELGERIALWLTEGLALAYHRGEIWKAIGRLTPDEQRYVVMRFWYGMTAREIEESGAVTGNVVWLWVKAKKKLHEDLKHLKAS